MLKSSDKNLAELIVEALSYGPNQTLEDIRENADSIEKTEFTLQAWYKALSRLSDESIVVKQGKRYSLNTSWIVDVLQFSESMRRHYLEDDQESIVLPDEERESKIFKFKDLLSMNTFWAHVLVKIASQTKDKTLYIYNPHFWFYLAHGDVEEQYSRSMEEMGVEIYLIVGSNSFLDKWNAKFFEDNVRHWLSPEPIYPERHKYYNALGEYFIEVTLSEETASKIEKIFTQAKSLSDVSQLELIDLFQKKSPCKMKITKKHSKAPAFKKKIKSYFP